MFGMKKKERMYLTRCFSNTVSLAAELEPFEHLDIDESNVLILT